MKRWFEMWEKEIVEGYREVENSGSYEDFYRDWYENYTEYCEQTEGNAIDYRDFIDKLLTVLA